MNSKHRLYQAVFFRAFPGCVFRRIGMAQEVLHMCKMCDEDLAVNPELMRPA